MFCYIIIASIVFAVGYSLIDVWLKYYKDKGGTFFNISDKPLLAGPFALVCLMWPVVLVIALWAVPTFLLSFAVKKILYKTGVLK